MDLQSAERGQAPATYLTLRSLLLGCVICGLFGLAGPYWCFYLMSSSMFSDYHTAGATFALLMLALVFNAGLVFVWRRLRLSGGELRFITAMTLTSGSIVTSGLIAYLIPGMTSPYYHSSAANQLEARVWPLLEGLRMQHWLFPLDPGGGKIAIKNFWIGLPRGEPIPWGPWIRPLIWWGVFVMAMFAVMVAIMTIMRKQWIDHEHLSYPIAQVPAELCSAAEDPWHRNSIIRSRAFWIGAGLTFLLSCSTGLRHYFGIFPQLRISHAVSGLGPMDLSINLGPVIVGLVFLIPNRVAFSVWFLALLSWVLRSFIRAYGFGMQEWMLYGVVGHPELQHVTMGSMLVFAGGSLWLARAHLKRVLASALGRLEGYDRGEPSSYRTAVLTVLVGSAIVVVWFCFAGMKPFYAVILLVLTLVIYYGMSRVIAQCGLPAINSPVVPSTYMASAFGSRVLGARQAVGLGANLTWHADLRNSPMSGAGHGMYLTGRRSKHLFWAMMLGLLISYVVASVCTIWLGYRHGATGLHQWYINNSSRLTWHWTSSMAQANADPSYVGLAWMLVGALVMGLLMLAHRSLFWWPIHPVGFLTNGAFLVTAFWFSIFMAWLIKVGVVYVGGQGLYRTARRFFIGVVLGNFAAGGIWAVIDTLADSSGNAVLSL
ncbi:MAG: DUF6785 family protein [Candidatus Brocadiia bacterium]